MATVTEVYTRRENFHDYALLDCGNVVDLGEFDDVNQSLVGASYACPSHPEEGCPDGAQGFYSYTHGNCPTRGETDPVTIDTPADEIARRLLSTVNLLQGHLDEAHHFGSLTKAELDRLAFLKWRVQQVIAQGVTGELPNGSYDAIA